MSTIGKNVEESKIEENNNTCGAPTEIYSRVVGFYRPIKQWNNGKKEEFGERKEYEAVLN